MRLRTLLSIGILVALALCIYKFWPERERARKPEALAQVSVKVADDKTRVLLLRFMEKCPYNAVAGCFIVIANHDGDLSTFLEAARLAGLEVRKPVTELGIALAVAKGRAQQESLAACLPSRATLEYDYIATCPDMTGAAAPEPDSFVISPGEALGCPQDVNWGKGVSVALLDMKVEPHPVLASASIVQYADSDAQIGAPGRHATAMASLVCGRGDEVTGVAQSARILNFVTLGGDGKGDLYGMAKGIADAVKAGARVICVEAAVDEDSQALRLAVSHARENNALVIAPSGESGDNQFPSSIEEVLCVGAMDVNGRLMGRPGAAPDIVAPGMGIPVAGPDNGVGLMDGSGAGAMLVSGVVAGLMYENQGLNPYAAADLLLAYADRSGFEPSDIGHGIVNVERVRKRTVQGLRDIAITGVEFAPNAAGGRAVRVAVQNKGTATTGFSLEVMVGGMAYRFNSQGLAANQFEFFAFDIPAGGEGEIFARAATQGQDGNLDNNVWPAQTSGVTEPEE